MVIKKNVILAPFTTFRIGGPADYFIVVNSTDEIQEAVRWAKSHSLPFFILGKGANILVGDKGYRGVVIKNEANKITFPSEYKNLSDLDISLDNTNAQYIDVESGATLEELITFTSQKGLSGFEHFAGIPSSIGGALWQNLHFLSPDRTKTLYIGDIVESAIILSSSKMLKETVNKEYFKFSYDYSILHDTKDIVLSATFLLIPENKNIIEERIKSNLEWRKEKHPENAAKISSGSIFKKIEGYGAGRLIEQAGLRGKIIGGAKISERHANFIVNYDNASAKDVRDLILLAQDKVKEEFSLELMPEISFVGEF